MPETVRCPGCGQETPAGSASCEHCNLPLAGAPGESSGGATGAPQPESDPAPLVLRPRPRRPPRPRPATGIALSLWLLFGVVAAVAVIMTAVQGYMKNNAPAVEGSSEDQQKRAGELGEILARDSTNVDARVELGNLYYDTGNWREAIVQYRSAIAHDSTRVHSIVDLGVCYFNLGQTAEATHLFELALAREPNQPVALFNLGIVSQQEGDHKGALGFFHRALMSSPPENMKQALMEAMQRSYQATGAQAPPIPDGR